MPGNRVIAAAFVIATSVDAVAHADGRRELTFADAVGITLAHNGDVQVARDEVAIAGDEVELASAAFAPKLVASTRFLRDDELGTPGRLAYTDQVTTGSLEVSGKVPTGMTYAVGVNAIAEQLAGPSVTIFNPGYTTSLTLSVTQPLLRGGWHAANRLPITVAGLRRAQSEQELRARLEQIVGELEVAYWGLALARKEREARQSSLKLAQDQLAESTRLAKLGTISELDVVEARAGLSRNQQALIRAQQDVTDAEGKLRVLMLGDAGASQDELVPVDNPDTSAPARSIEEHLRLARANRPDVAAAHAQLAAEQTGVEVTENDMLPALDVVVNGGVLGFAGTLDPMGPFGMTTPDPAVTGGFGTAVKNVGHGNYIVSLGLRLELPIDNSAARARNARQRHISSRARAVEQALLARVESEVRTSIALLEQDAALEKAADEAVTITSQLLAGMRKRFASGGATSFDVLRVSDELARAQIEAARARISFRISLARLATANGTLLQERGIAVRPPS